ncbi:uncharacterized protein [Cherax quadricarinatus]|uniref:uncharacterized protein n=1 Tax=Cherax quadricarinatus TaxID=27406 RepID=UPI00387E818F
MASTFLVSQTCSQNHYKARVVVWTYDNRQEYGSYTVHREEVAAVGVTAGEEYVVSLGGILDGYLVIWHIPSRRPLTSVVAGEPGLGIATLLCTAPRTPTLMLVGGVRMLRAWSLNPDNNRLTPTPISLGLLERNYTCLQIDECEELVYASTTTGDVVKVKLSITPGQAVGVAVLVSVMAPRPTPTPGAPTLIRAPTPDLGSHKSNHSNLQQEYRNTRLRLEPSTEEAALIPRQNTIKIPTTHSLLALSPIITELILNMFSRHTWPFTTPGLSPHLAFHHTWSLTTPGLSPHSASRHTWLRYPRSSTRLTYKIVDN